MIHVNARAIIIKKDQQGITILIQKRTKKKEECYEFPGGRMEEYESITDALRREVKEETGLDLSFIENECHSMITKGVFETQCIRPYCSYQTISGPVDSFGLHFICEAKGEPLIAGDDSSDIHWASIDELKVLINQNQFSEIDKPALLMFMKERM